MPAADSDDSTVPAPNDATFHISLADDSAVPAPDDVDDNNTSAVADNSAVPAPDDVDDNNTSVDENINLNGSVVKIFINMYTTFNRILFEFGIILLLYQSLQIQKEMCTCTCILQHHNGSLAPKRL